MKTLLLSLFLLLWSGPSFAQGTCSAEFDVPPDYVSVAWVAPVGKDVWFNGHIDVVRTSDLAEHLSQSSSPTVARLLQVLGLRKSGKPPWRRYMVTVFDVPADLLCRAVDNEEVTTISGIKTCKKPGRTTKRKMPCGYAVDRTTGLRTVDRFRIRWNDAAANGFCVLPAQRYLKEGL